MLGRSLLIACGLVLTLTAGIGASPWLLYEIGLAKIDGRPAHARRSVVTPKAAEALLRKLRIQQPIQLDPLSPFSYARAFLDGAPEELGASARIAWIIARS